MAIRQVRIDSYFSLMTDLATQMMTWREFVRGIGYDVELKADTEYVSIAFRPAQDDDCAHVLVRGEGDGPLFERVLGFAAFAMSAHSDSIWISRWPDQSPG